MNRLLLLLILMFPFALTANEIMIKVRIDQANEPYFNIQEVGKESSFRIDLKADNTSNFLFNLEQEGFLTLTYQGQSFPIYLQLEDAIEIVFNGNDIKNSLSFSGNGAANNNMIAAYQKRFGSLNKSHFEAGYLDVQFDTKVIDDIQNLSAEQFKAKLDKLSKEKLNFLNGQSGINEKLKKIYFGKVNWDKVIHKTAWLVTNYNMQSPNELASNRAILSLADQKNFIAEEFLDNQDFKNYINALVINKYLPKDPFKYNIHPSLYSIIEQNFSSKVKWYAQTHLLLKVYERSGNAELGRDKIREFANVCPYPEYQARLMEMYGGEISGVEDVKAPDIDMVDKSGNYIGLSSYKGQVVYISFWASWCKPCIEGFKKNKDLRQKLEAAGVILLNVSIDKKEEAWKDAMIRHRPLGVNGRVVSLSDVSKNYDISAIPLYHIVDKNGKFTYLSDKANRDILQEFIDLVQK